MSKHSARLTRAEQESHQRILEELAQRRDVLRWVVFASDAEPDLNYPGYWRSETFDLLAGLPSSLIQRGMEAIGYEWDIQPEPSHDEEQNQD